ncbi:hypothetical protein [Paraburkholderia sp. XV]|uniref:hypothetical protein n=1 Tax=Paraburkholderia sp. XV TaxID=2831520 RepID=UPI001CD52F23|nr:hypothetical protein [Paraburkholderia sp. XV]
MDKAGRPDWHRWLSRCIYVVCASATLAIATTWLGAIFDFPVDFGVVAGMKAPECAPVRASPAGSQLAAALPESDRCLAFFMYRASFPDAADDAASYQTWVLQRRVAEFWQLIGYVLVLWFVILCVSATAALAIRARIRRMRRSSAHADAAPTKRGGRPYGST